MEMGFGFGLEDTDDGIYDLSMISVLQDAKDWDGMAGFGSITV